MAREYALLGVLALLWGSSYLFIKVAVAEIPPLTLIAIRVAGAALFLGAIMACRRTALPRGAQTWRRLGLQAVFNSIGAWTVLAWGQQHTDAGLAAVLNSTSPVFVLLWTWAVSRGETGPAQAAGAVLGIAGVVLIVGPEALGGLGRNLLGQFACLAGAALYAAAAIHGRRFAHLPPLATATGTMLWASAALIPAALILDRPWDLRPSADALAAAAALAIPCTGIALLIYFRLVRTLGAMGVASQSYLRAGIGVVLGIVVLGESLTAPALGGLALTLAGVALINRPALRAGRSRASRRRS